MKRTQQGFTLIELVMVIVILGVLAAVAVPKFVDLSSDARSAAVQGVAGGITSASSVNYAARSANSARGTATNTNCSSAAAAILEGGLPTGYSLNSGTTIATGASVTCLVTGPNSVTANATIIGIN